MAFFLLNLETAPKPKCNVTVNAEIQGATIDFSPTIVSGALKTGETIIGNNGMFISACCNRVSYESSYKVNPPLAAAAFKNAIGGTNSSNSYKCCLSMSHKNGVLVNSNLVNDTAGYSGYIDGNSTVNYGGNMIGNSGIQADGTCDYTNYENSASNSAVLNNMGGANQALAHEGDHSLPSEMK